jgi:hypothetical protein
VIEGSPILLTIAYDLRSNGDEKRYKNAAVIRLPLFRSEAATIHSGLTKGDNQQKLTPSDISKTPHQKQCEGLVQLRRTLTSQRDLPSSASFCSKGATCHA